MAAFVLAMTSVPTSALQPCPREADEYRELLRAEIKRQIPQAAVATFLVIPSFSPEYGLVVSTEGDSAHVTVLRFVESVWGTSWVNGPTPGTRVQDFSKSRLVAKKHRSTVSLELATFVKEILANKTSFSDRWSAGVDGTTYVFTTKNGRCGETWSPENGTQGRLLVEAFERLAQLAEGSSPHKHMEEVQLLDNLKARWANLRSEGNR